MQGGRFVISCLSMVVSWWGSTSRGEEHSVDGGIESVCEAENGAKGKVLASLLYGAHIASVQLCRGRKLLLGPASRPPESANSSTQRHQHVIQALVAEIGCDNGPC